MILFYSIFAAVFMAAAVHENAWKKETSSIKTVSHTWDNTEDVKEQIRCYFCIFHNNVWLNFPTFLPHNMK